MADNILRLRVESNEYDQKLKKAAEGIRHLAEVAHRGGRELTGLEKAELDYVKALGSMETKSRTAAGGVRELESVFKELTVVYNHLNDVEKQDEGGKALRASLEQIKQRAQEARTELEAASKSLQGAENSMKGGGGLFSGIGSKMEGALAVFGGNLMTKGVELAASAMTSLISETGDMIKQGVEMAKQGEGVRIAFERLGRGDILQGLREATHGTVSDLELMKAAVQFNDFKLPLDQLGTMLAFAQQKAKDTGQSVDYLVQSIVTGLGRKSLMILDNLGLSAAEIKERMKETGDMTKAVGAIIRDQMAAAGDYVETAADRAAQANVSLQNKMEELGRKFAPVEEASNQLWTSIKIGILDIIGGPLAKLLNGLTEAGRRLNAMNDVNGNDGNGQSLAQRRLNTLREYSGSQKGVTKQTVYDRTVARYAKEEEQAWRKANEFAEKYKNTLKELDNVDPRTDEKGVHASAIQQQANKYKQQQEKYTYRAQAIRSSRAEYQQGAQQILNPITPVVDTKQAETNVKKLRQQLKELEEQRKKAVTAGDQEQVDNLTKQISQTKTNLGYLDPSATKGAKAVQDDFTEIIGLIGNAQERVSDLQRQIRESWDQNEITTLNQKLKDAQNELDVLMGKLPKDTVVDITVDVDTAKALQKIGDIEGVTIAPKTVEITATDEALPELVDIEGITITPKTFAITATDEALPKLRDIEGVTIEPKTFAITATDEALPKLRDIQGVTIEPKTFTITATDEALPKLSKIDGITINPKTVTITATDEALPKLRDIEGVTIEPKTFAITATDEALPKLRDIQGVTIEPKTFTITATDEALPKLRDIQGVTIEPKTFTITATDEAMPKLRDIEGVTIEPKTFAITATDEAMPKLRDIQGVTIDPKTFTITATDEAMPELVDIEGITITPKTFTITATDEAMPKLREIQGITIDDKTMTVTAETADALRALQGIEGVIIDPKTVTITATDEAMPKLRDIQGVTIEPKTFAITATDEAMPKLRDIEGVTIEPKNMTVTADTTEALKRVQELIAQVNGTVVEIKVEPVITDEDIERSLREQYGKPIEVPITPMTAADKLELEVRTKLSDQNIEADMQTLRTLMEAQIKNGIEGIEIPTGFLIEKIMGEGVPDEYWQKLQDQFNEKLKELGIEPIKINFKTGNIANVGKETEKSWRGAASAMSAAGSALQGLEDPGAKIAGIVGQAIANIALGFSQATAASSSGGIFGWIAAIAGGLTTMLSTIAAIHSATGYAQGGIVDGRGGGFVGGMAYSGDNIGNVRLDSGELVLNHAQQNNLANALEGGNNNNVENRQPYVNGELIFLGLNNYLKRTGRGEIVVSKR